MVIIHGNTRRGESGSVKTHQIFIWGGLETFELIETVIPCWFTRNCEQEQEILVEIWSFYEWKSKI